MQKWMEPGKLRQRCGIMEGKIILLVTTSQWTENCSEVITGRLRAFRTFVVESWMESRPRIRFWKREIATFCVLRSLVSYPLTRVYPSRANTYTLYLTSPSLFFWPFMKSDYVFTAYNSTLI